jgi:hypothetical protein
MDGFAEHRTIEREYDHTEINVVYKVYRDSLVIGHNRIHRASC